MRSTKIFVVLLFLSRLSFAQTTAPAVAITHVTVIDVAGGPARSDMTVLIRDGRITAVGPSGGALPKKTQLVDGHGKFLIPGLWDMHVHLSWTTDSAIPVLIANGVTSVRDMGSRLDQLDDWRAKIGAGVMTGPRITRCGPILNGKKFNEYQLVSGNPDETRGVARALKQVGVDFLKVHRRMPRESYFALIDEAKALGLTVVGHIPMTVSPEEASDAGQVTFEHTETLFEGTFATALKDRDLADGIRRFRAEQADALFARFVKNHNACTPTLIAYHTILIANSLADDPNFRYVAKSQKDAMAKQPALTAAELAGYARTFAELKEVVRQMNHDGVTILAGTDIAGPRIPGFTLHEELAQLVEAGLTPLQALQAATLTPAQVLKQDHDLGTIETGKLADLILLDGNPLDDIHNTTRISAVIARGKLLRRPQLDALLNDAAALASHN